VPADQALLTAHLMALKKSTKKYAGDRDVAEGLERTIADKELELEKLALPQNLWKRDRPLRERIASRDTPRSQWSYHASSRPGVPQDAYPDDPQSRREVQVVRLQ
jgi:hypothetical protein